MKVLTVVGARPQFIKASVVSKAMKNFGEIEELIVHTGQHFDKEMSDVFFSELRIPEPTYNLGIGGLNHGAMTGKMLESLERILIDEEAELTICYGDTNSTLAAALASSKLCIPIAHVESGLRSYNKKMPEEQNRILTDHLSSLLFTPTFKATENLLREGLNKEQIFEVGDVMRDAVDVFRPMYEGVYSELGKKLDIADNEYILTTLHRAENTASLEKLRGLVEILEILSKESRIIFPMHPRTLQSLEKNNLFDRVDRSVKIIEPVGYFEMMALEAHAGLILTDSGGVQKEAYFHNKPCVTLREETEWQELVEIGVNSLCSLSEPRRIVDVALSALNGTKSSLFTENLYGEGKSSKLIASEIFNFGRRLK